MYTWPGHMHGEDTWCVVRWCFVGINNNVSELSGIYLVSMLMSLWSINALKYNLNYNAHECIAGYMDATN